MFFSFGMLFLFHYFLLSQESIGIVGHIVPRGWHVSESIFKELAPSANRAEMVPVSSAQVVECPLDLVNKDMEIKVLKNKEDDIHFDDNPTSKEIQDEMKKLRRKIRKNPNKKYMTRCHSIATILVSTWKTM